MTAFTEACHEIMAASVFLELVGPCGHNPESAYRDLIKTVHPDVAGDKGTAEAATTKLNRLWDEYNGRAASSPVTISTKKRTYVLGEPAIQGDLANVYPVIWNDGDVRNGLLKLPRSPSDSDLMEREAKALKLLDKGDPKYRVFAPSLVETFRHKDAVTKEVRRANVLEPLMGFYSVAEIIQANPQGIDPRDMVWMWRRLFVAIGLAYDNGVVHGAVVPKHVMIHPAQHGVCLIDWCYSSIDGQAIPAIVPGYEPFYPESVFYKHIPTHAVDVAMAAHTMVSLCGDKLPRELRAFARGCQVSNPPKPAELLGEFDELIDRLWGPRKFREFKFPT